VTRRRTSSCLIRIVKVYIEVQNDIGNQANGEKLVSGDKKNLRLNQFCHLMKQPTRLRVSSTSILEFLLMYVNLMFVNVVFVVYQL